MPELHISPEFDLMVKILKNRNGEMPEPSGNMNWEKWLELIKAHGVAAIIYKKIRDLDIPGIRDDVLNGLKMGYLNNIARNMEMCAGISSFQRELAEQGIRALIFKGPVTAGYAYDDYALRSYQDIDMLIGPDDFENFYNFIKEKKFVLLFKMNKPIRKWWARMGREYTFGERKRIFDLHFRIQRGPDLAGRSLDLFEHSADIEINGETVRALSAEMSVISICINGTKDGWTDMKSLNDLSAMIHNHPEMNWETVIRTARQMKVYSMLLTGLSLARGFLATGIPDEIPADDLRAERIRKLTDIYRCNLAEGYIINKKNDYRRCETKCVDSAWGRFRYRLYYIFVPKMSDINNLRIPGFLFPVFMILRPLFLVLRIGKTTAPQPEGTE